MNARSSGFSLTVSLASWTMCGVAASQSTFSPSATALPKMGTSWQPTITKRVSLGSMPHSSLIAGRIGSSETLLAVKMAMSSSLA